MSLTYTQRLRAKAASSPFPAEREAFNRKADELERRDQVATRLERERAKWAAHYRECARLAEDFRPAAAFVQMQREVVDWCRDRAARYERGELL